MTNSNRDIHYWLPFFWRGAMPTTRQCLEMPDLLMVLQILRSAAEAGHLSFSGLIQDGVYGACQ